MVITFNCFPRRRFFLFAFIFIVVSADASAQTTEHQRTAVAGKNDLRCTLSYSSVLYSMTTDLGPSLELDSTLGIDLSFKEIYEVSALFPFMVIAGLNNTNVNKFGFAAGDPEIAASVTARSGDWQLSAKASYTCPLGIWNPYQAKESKLISGTGYHRLEGTVSALKYMDPIAAGCSLGAEHCFGKAYKEGTGSIPLSVSLGLFATEALNGAAALSAGIYQQYSSAPRIDGIPEQPGGRYSLSAALSLLLNKNPHSASIGISKSLSDLASPFALRFELAYTLKKEDSQ